MTTLIKSGLTSLPALQRADPNKLVSILSQHLDAKKCHSFTKALSSLPDLDVQVQVSVKQEKGKDSEQDIVMTGVAQVTLTRTSRGAQNDTVYSPAFPKTIRELWWLVLGDPEV